MKTEKEQYTSDLTPLEKIRWFYENEGERLITLEKVIGTSWYKILHHKHYFTECYEPGGKNYYKFTEQINELKEQLKECFEELDSINRVYNNRYGNTMRNDELQKLLQQFPGDALVAVEYCNVRQLKYHSDRNLITID